MPASPSPVLRVQRWVVFTSLGLFVLKVIAYLLTNSVAVLTDALESTVNVVTAFTGLYSLRVSARPRDADHPYGHGKIELISASFEGLLIVVAGLLIVYESITHLIDPQPVQQLDAGMALIGFTAVANYALGAWCLRTAQRHHSVALRASGKHLQSDTWSTLGIVAGLLLIRLTGLAWVDSAVALFFAGFIMIEGSRIIRQTVAGIMDEADEALLRQLARTLDAKKQKNWIDLHNLRIIKYGAILHVDCHLTVPWYFNVNEAHAEVDALNAVIQQDFDQSLETFVHTDGCVPPHSCRLCPRIECHVREHVFEGRMEWTYDNLTRNKKHGV
jgi:cation diffusion facilitator family transporter